MSTLQCASSWIPQINKPSTISCLFCNANRHDLTGMSGEAFEVRSLNVHLVRGATKPQPLYASLHCSHS
jgi:hypothetical protein